jgi:hypothetical protein
MAELRAGPFPQFVTVPQRRPLTLNLRLGEEVFPVKKTDLLEKLALFQKNPALLSADDYEVKTSVPSADFEKFIGIIEGGPLSVSESTLDSFWRLSEEFGFELLSAASTAFLASNEYFIETAPVLRPRVTIRRGTHSTTYESFKSLDEIVSFAVALKYAGKDSIVVEGMKGKDRLVEKAVEAVYCNTVSDLGLNETTKPFLVLVLWVIQDQLELESIDAMIYCLNRLKEIAPTSFDLARLLLLSQSDVMCRDDFVLTLSNSLKVIAGAVGMLQTENNGRRKEARELLLKLRNTGRFADMGLLEPPIWTYASLPAARPAPTPEKTVSESQSGRIATTVLPETTDNLSWYRRLFLSWFRPQSADTKHSPVSAAVGESAPEAQSRVCDRPLIELPVVDVNWFR